MIRILQLKFSKDDTRSWSDIEFIDNFIYFFVSLWHIRNYALKHPITTLKNIKDFWEKNDKRN